ncbi:hypothetical protein CFP56_043911 [Quercus suber]|uniref:DNA repair metallo-beta-lactamase domain-containing protein n=1 Tax=Quercus suber TaxID=58331 RepID=A0AAW0IQ72_QUESU
MNEAVRDQFGVWHVCYSIHSSKEELEWALQLLVPRWAISTTPSCRAMELDFVKKHCFGNQVASNDPIWKLLQMWMYHSMALVVLLWLRSTPKLMLNQFEPVKSIVLSTNNDPPQIAADKVEELSFQEEAEVKCHNSESKTGQILDYNIRSQWIKKLKFITMLL